MSFETKSVQSLGGLSEKTLSDKFIENRKPLAFALNVILLMGLVTAAFTGGVSLIIAASIYGGAMLASNGSFQIAISNMRNSRTEMRLAYQVAKSFGERKSFEGFKQSVNKGGNEGVVPGLMIAYFQLSATEQKRLRNLAEVSGFEYSAYEKSSDGQLAQAEIFGSDDREKLIGWNLEDLQEKRRQQEETQSKIEEMQNEINVRIAWQLWLRDSSQTESNNTSLQNFKNRLDRLDPAEKQARLKLAAQDFQRKSQKDRQTIADRARIPLSGNAVKKTESEASDFEKGFLNKMFPQSQERASAG